MLRRTAKVIRSHQQSYVDPITIQVGDMVEASGKEDSWNGWIWIWCTNLQGKSGWVPKSYVELSGSTGRALYDYSAIELSVNSGEEVVIEKEESGWVWCVKRDGKRGWVPLENIEVITASS